MISDEKNKDNGFLAEIDVDFQPHWKISSNTLCNYMKKQEYLTLILKNQAIIPRFVIEPLGYLGLEEVDKICFPMTCFCDIPFSKVATHMSRYGEYGIGFDKERLIEKYFVQPIHYINPQSPLANDFKEAFSSFYGKDELINKDMLVLLNYLTSTLLYMKPLYAVETSDEGKRNIYNYQDECEWRYIPLIESEDVPLVIPRNITSIRARDTYTGVLYHHPEYWIKYEWDDVRYLIVPDELAAKSIIQTIMELSLTLEEKHLLISKIEISRQFSDNM